MATPLIRYAETFVTERLYLSALYFIPLPAKFGDTMCLKEKVTTNVHEDNFITYILHCSGQRHTAGPRYQCSHVLRRQNSCLRGEGGGG